jgi:8-oxo-dGTP pyrophosphatase MutT (NUDIX family)
MLDLDPARAAAPTKDAATVVVVREISGAVELFCVERHARSGFMAGAIVFPGGKLDPSDRDGAWQALATGLAPRARSLASAEIDALGFAVAALRELLEEGAILPVVGDGVDSARALDLREELARRQSASGALAFAELLSAHALRLDTLRLEALWRWITPVAETRRYDTRFYLLPLPPGQSGLHDRHETTSSFWATPAQVLERWERSEIFLAPPTSRTLEILVDAKSFDDARVIAAARSLDPLCPAFCVHGDQTLLTLPGDPLHPEPAPTLPPAGEPTRFVLQGTRFVAMRPSPDDGG